MKVEIVARERHQVRAGKALLAGFKRHGVQAEIVAHGCAEIVACWGWRDGKELSRGRRILVMEQGYVGDRANWTSLAWDGLNGRGKVPPVEDGGERWRKNFSALMKTWRSGGDNVVVMGQLHGDASIDGVDMEEWYRRALEAAKRFNLPVLFRPHPRSPQGAKSSLDKALDQARAVFTFNSNSGVDAVLAGVQTIVCDEGSMAWPVAGHGLHAELQTPDRSAWCAALAWRQWKNEEIESGEAWDYLKGMIQ